MSKIRVMIVEDQILTAENLKEVVEEAGFSVVAMVDSGEDCLRQFTIVDPDVVLMDIQINGNMDGIETADRLKENFDVPVIFITDFDDQHHLNRSKRVEPDAFIIKPFQGRAVVIAIELAFNRHFSKEIKPSIQPKSGRFVVNDKIFVRKDNVYEGIPIEDILFIQADRGYSQIVTASNGDFMLAVHLSIVQKKLSDKGFLRVHRSYVVNTSKIEKLEESHVFIDSHEVPVSKTYKKILKSHLEFI